MKRSDWSVHITMADKEHPEFAWVSRDDLEAGCYWVADQEFGPFDTWLDLHRWLAKVVREDLAARPG